MKEQSTALRAAEASRQIQPAWLYRITYGAETYFFTGYDKPISVAGGPGDKMDDPQTFLSVPIEHVPPRESADVNSQPTTVALAANDTLLRRYFVTAPTGSIEIEIWRVNSASLPGPIDYGDLYLDFKGVCQSVSFAGYQIEAAFLAPVQSEERTVPGYFYQKTCNHVLGNRYCGVNRENFKRVTTLDAVDRVNKTVDITVTAFNVDSPPRSHTVTNETFQGGSLIDSASNQIGIIACESVSAGVWRLWLAFWPGTLTAGATVTAYMGCLKIVRICDDTFANKPNFGGMPYIPITNPATNSILT